MAGLVAGIDLGGTKMLTAILDEEGRILGKHKVPTPRLSGGEDLVALIASEIEAACQEAGVLDRPGAIGVTVPGTVDLERGYLMETPNLGIWDFPLKDRLQEELGTRVIMENDVNAGMYGEFVFGAARGYRHIVAIYPGTGVGGGIIIDGRLYRGVSGSAGEIGHMKIQVEGKLCGCGQRGCLEAMASKTAIAKDLAHLALTGRAPSILEKAGTDFDKIKSGMIKKSIQAGESAVLELVERAAWYLGIGIANIVNIFNPQLVVLGGGLMGKLNKWMLPVTEKALQENAMPFLLKQVKLVAAELGDDSVALGVGVLAREAL